jgi:hypothetical protein
MKILLLMVVLAALCLPAMGSYADIPLQGRQFMELMDVPGQQVPWFAAWVLGELEIGIYSWTDGYEVRWTGIFRGDQRAEILWEDTRYAP